MNIEERYYHAISSTDLKMEAHRVKDIDLVLAHGLSGSRLGLSMMRLRSQWDASTLRFKHIRFTDAMIYLPELPRVYAGLLHVVGKRNWDEALVPQAIEFFLDQHCRKCKGVGALSVGGMMKTCPRCGGSSQRAIPPVLDDLMHHINESCASARGTARKRLNLHRA